MSWLEFVTVLENANVGINEDNICEYEDEIFNQVLANFDNTFPKGILIQQELVINKIKLEIEFPVIQGEFDTEPGNIKILRINGNRVS